MLYNYHSFSKITTSCILKKDHCKPLLPVLLLAPAALPDQKNIIYLPLFQKLKVPRAQLEVKPHNASEGCQHFKCMRIRAFHYITT